MTNETTSYEVRLKIVELVQSRPGNIDHHFSIRRYRIAKRVFSRVEEKLDRRRMVDTLRCFGAAGGSPPSPVTSTNARSYWCHNQITPDPKN
mmetsp:Transcript_38677/g.93694  ORF Transcript_38677/g.93694 Transcript_38677/m.93694 type:complete len:92 (-) Transcript_38677:315-590(-)